jgi:hypothetical protein
MHHLAENLMHSFRIYSLDAPYESGLLYEEGIGISEMATDLIAGVVTGRKISLRPST